MESSLHTFKNEWQAEHDYPQCETDWIEMQHFLRHEVLKPARDLNHCQCSVCCRRFCEPYVYWWQSGDFFPASAVEPLHRTQAPERISSFKDVPWELRYGQLPQSSVREGSPPLREIYIFRGSPFSVAAHTPASSGCLVPCVPLTTDARAKSPLVL